MTPRGALSADSLVLVLSSGDGENVFFDEGFASELALTMDTYRVERRSLEGAGFASMTPDEKIAIAGQLLTETDASAVLWLESENEAATGIGLYVTVSERHLARMVTFDAPIDFVPDVALITSGLVEHALAYGRQTEGTDGTGGAPPSKADAPGENGMGRHIPVPDGWLLVSPSPPPPPADLAESAPPEPSEAVAEETAAPDPGQAATFDAEGKETGAARAASSTNTSESSPHQNGQAEHRGKVVRPRKVGLAARFSLDQGVSAFTGGGTWIGGGAELSYSLFPEVLIQLAFYAEGGAFPRDKAEVSGTRLIPEIGAAYLFALGPLGLGPEIRVAPCRTAVRVSAADHLPKRTEWWAFRASLGPAMRWPLEKRVSLYLSVLISVYTKGERFVSADEDGREVFKTPLAELAARAGILLLI